VRICNVIGILNPRSILDQQWERLIALQRFGVVGLSASVAGNLGCFAVVGLPVPILVEVDS
jgi:hypothetical protein